MIIDRGIDEKNHDRLVTTGRYRLSVGRDVRAGDRIEQAGRFGLAHIGAGRVRAGRGATAPAAERRKAKTTNPP